MPITDKYLELIEDICTLKIGHILVNNKIKLKVFPEPRFLEKKEKSEN